MIKNGFKKLYFGLSLLFLWLALTTCGPQAPGPPGIAVYPYPQTVSQPILPLTGTKTAGSTILVNGQAITGYDSNSFFAIEIPLVPGPNSFQLLAMNSLGNQSPAVAVTTTLNATPPNPPVLTNSSLSSGISPILLTGTKDAGTDVLLNGKEIVGYSSTSIGSATNWSYSFTPTTTGNNTLRLASKNPLGVSSPSVTYILSYTGSFLIGRPIPWPIAPLDGETSGSGRNLTFTWLNATSPTSTQFQMSSTPDFTTSSLMVDQPVLSLPYVWTPGTALPGTYYWRVGAVDTANNVFYGQVRGFYYGKVSGDVNGDGYADILIGAEGNYATGANGTVSIYYGAPGTPAPNIKPNVVLTGETPGDDFGSAIAVGDINGDGYDDIIVGARRNSAGGFEAGRVYIYYGRPGVVLNKPDVILTGLEPGEHFGVSLASGSDVNGDGYDDLLVGANLNSANGSWAGRAYLYYGGHKILNVPDRVFTGEAPGDHFGISVSMGGDINGDGFGDFLIGAGGDETATHTGKAYLYYGGFNQGVIPDKTFASLAQGDGFGRMVKIIKDADGDGFADFLVGAPYYPVGPLPGVGQAHLYLGGPNLALTPIWTLTNPLSSSNAYFGFSAAAPGDIGSKDGYADWVIGAWGGTPVPKTYPGWAAVYKGNPTLFTSQPSPAFNIYSGTSSQNEGFSVALSSPGDFNGDGIPDLIVGAMYANQGDGVAYFYDGHFNTPPFPDAVLGWPGTPGALVGFGYDVH